MDRPLVIKIGGSTLGEADSTFADVAALARSGDVPIVVHGGGAEATRWLEAMSVPSRFEDGLRVTDEAALPVIVAVYAGLVNKRIVSALNAAGATAAGICGADAGLVECRMADPRLGFVGEPVAVHPGVLEAFLGAGIVPVVGPVAFVPGETGHQLVNVNADTVAAEIAAAVHAREAVFLTDVPGVNGADGKVIRELSAADAEGLIGSGIATGGMIPKLRSCLRATAGGVPARILDGRTPGALASRESHGTLIIPGA